MGNTHRSFEILPFYASIIEEMKLIKIGIKDAVPRAVALARIIRQTKCTECRGAVRQELQDMVDRLGGIKRGHKKHKRKKKYRFNSASVSVIYSAFEALDRQDAETLPRTFRTLPIGSSSSKLQRPLKADTVDPIPTC